MLTNAARFWLLETTNEACRRRSTAVVGMIFASGAASSDGSTCGPEVVGARSGDGRLLLAGERVDDAAQREGDDGHRGDEDRQHPGPAAGPAQRELVDDRVGLAGAATARGRVGLARRLGRGHRPAGPAGQRRQLLDAGDAGEDGGAQRRAAAGARRSDSTSSAAVSLQLGDLAAAVGAPGQVLPRTPRCSVGVQGVERVRGGRVVDLAHDSTPSTLRRLIRPSRMRVLTVPSGSLSRSATWLWV